jgi:spore germination protein
MLVLASLLTVVAQAAEQPGAHAAALAEQPEAPRSGLHRTRTPPPPPPPTEGPEATVYGYWPYWGDDLDTVAWDQLSHIAIFGVVLESDGSLSGTGNWTAVAAQAVELGRRYEVKVHLCLIGFEDDVHAAVFPSESRRRRTIEELVALVDAYGADGVNVDIEGLDNDLKDDFTTFIQELNAEVGELYLATPAVDWSAAYDYDELAAASDGLFIMAYGYHYSSSDPGPNSPLHGGDPWSDRAIDWSVDDYRDNGTPDDKIIVGLPLYGRSWPTTDTSVPGDATGEGSSVTWVSAIAQGEQYGRHWDAVTSTPYTFPDGTHQLWYDDHQSLEDKIGWSVEQGLQGVGFWALTYEDGDPDLWSMVQRLTAADPDPHDTDDSAPFEDSQAPGDSDDPGDPPGLRGLDGTGCGCGAGPAGRGGLLALLSLLGLSWRRRR